MGLDSGGLRDGWASIVGCGKSVRRGGEGCQGGDVFVGEREWGEGLAWDARPFDRLRVSEGLTLTSILSQDGRGGKRGAWENRAATSTRFFTPLRCVQNDMWVEWERREEWGGG